MDKLSHTVFVTLFTLSVVVTGNDPVLESKYKLKNNKKLRETFNKLIYSVTSVNEERLSALKNFYDLQNYLPKVSRSRETPIVAIISAKRNKDPEIKVNLNDLNNRGPSVAPSGKSVINTKAFENGREDKRSDKNEIASDERFNSDGDMYLRRWKSCSKKAAKTCTKACKSAFKDICSDYKCSKSMKKAMKKRCKGSCKSKFEDED